jgi:hypothetical protein
MKVPGIFKWSKGTSDFVRGLFLGVLLSVGLWGYYLKQTDVALFMNFCIIVLIAGKITYEERRK